MTAHRVGCHRPQDAKGLAGGWHGRPLEVADSKMDENLSIATVALLRELHGGHVTATPLADLSLVSFGGDEDAALQELERFLEEQLPEEPPTTLGRYGIPPGSYLGRIRGRFERYDLPLPARTTAEILLEIVVIPEGLAHWVLVPALDHIVYVPREAELEVFVAADVARIASVREIDRLALTRLLPARESELRPLEVALSSGGETLADRQRAARKARVEEHLRARALTTLRSIGSAVGEKGALPVLVGREEALTELGAMLDGTTRASVVVVGEAAAGKTSLVRAWARASRRHVFATSGAELVAGASGLGEWQERLNDVLAAGARLDAVLFFENLGELLGDRPEEGGVDVAGALRPWITEGRVRIVGEITPELFELEQRRHVSLFAALRTLFLKPLDAPGAEAALRAHGERWAKEESHRPRLADDAARVVVSLADRYLPYAAFPGKAVRLVEELRARQSEAAVTAPPPIEAADIYEAFALSTGMPAFLLRDDRRLDVEWVERELARGVVGQREAVRGVAETLCVVKARLQPPDKPLCTFLFVGPTGVGKTELARTLARFLFGDEDRLSRFDMSEYADPHAADRLIAGTAEEDGLLTRKVREQPFVVLLLDEIEKAHPAVLDLLLQVLGEGRLSDARGRTTFFHNAIIILTSNLGATHAAEPLGMARRDAPSARYHAAIHAAFRPELVNRLDRIVAFGPLGLDELRAVVRIGIARIADRRGFAQASVALEVTDAAADLLAAEGHSDVYGVRALRRHLDAALVTPIAALLSRLGRESAGAFLWIASDDDGVCPHHGARQRMIAERHGSLRFELFRRPGASGRLALGGVAAVASHRREADALMRLDVAEQVSERLASLRSELALASSRSRRRKKPPLTGREMEELHRDHHRLASAWDTAEKAREELVVAEELCVAALLEGEEAKSWVVEADGIYEAFRSRFFYVCVAERTKRDAITLRLQTREGRGLAEAWLERLLDGAPARGFRVRVHVRGSITSPPPWPEARPWSSPRDERWIRSEVVKHPGRFSTLLVTIEGPHAAVLLPFEAGLHRERDGDETRSFEIALIALRSDLSDTDWLHHELVELPPSGSPGNVTAAREYGDDEIAIFKERVLPIGPANAFSALERVALEVYLHHLEAGTLDGVFTEALVPREA
jgi:ATP-dependent Clp protease ATP-binding subunit ClpC